MSKRPRCMALTKAGDQCRGRAKDGSDFCGAHSGATGRPTKLSRELANAVAELVRQGAYWEEAALSIGISRASLYAWREEGEADLEHGRDTVFSHFLDAITRASAEAEAQAASALYRHRFTDWRAALAFLERRNPAQWGKREHVEHSGTVRTPEPELVEPESDEHRARVLRILDEAEALRRRQQDTNTTEETPA